MAASCFCRTAILFIILQLVEHNKDITPHGVNQSLQGYLTNGGYSGAIGCLTGVINLIFHGLLVLFRVNTHPLEFNNLHQSGPVGG